MLMNLRKVANHPLLLRIHYNENLLKKISKDLLKEERYADANPNLIFEDMGVMHDFEIHMLCKQFKSVEQYQLDDEKILNSGKFQKLDELLAQCKENGQRVLLFSQFTMMLDIIEGTILKFLILKYSISDPKFRSRGVRVTIQCLMILSLWLYLLVTLSLCI